MKQYTEAEKRYIIENMFLPEHQSKTIEQMLKNIPIDIKIREIFSIYETVDNYSLEDVIIDLKRLINSCVLQAHKDTANAFKNR